MKFFDLHADTPLILDEKTSNSSVVELKNHPFDIYKQVMAIFIRDGDKTPFESYKRRVSLIKSHLKNSEFPFLTKSLPNSSGAFLTVENASFLAEDINRIYTLKNDGVVALSLTWNGDNPLASGANGEGGITPLGKEVINKMNSLGLVLDISHLNHKSAMEAIELANKVFASHTAIYSLNPHPRNLKDEAILALKQKQGLIGLCFYPLFLGGDNVFKSLCDSAEYLISLGMEQNIALGSDFDGAEMSFFLSKTTHIPNLFNEFCSRGFKKSTVNKIFYKNAIDFFNKICENK